jgi:hypothetical protein
MMFEGEKHGKKRREQEEEKLNRKNETLINEHA